MSLTEDEHAAKASTISAAIDDMPWKIIVLV